MLAEKSGKRPLMRLPRHIPGLQFTDLLMGSSTIPVRKKLRSSSEAVEFGGLIKIGSPRSPSLAASWSGRRAIRLIKKYSK
jgi:hypothetical protein